MSLRHRSQPLSKWSTTSLYLLLIPLSQSILVNSQYMPPQALSYRRTYVNSTLVGRGDESNDKTKDNSDAQSQSQSQSKELRLVSHEDFCVYGLSEENKGKMLSESVDNVISYCSKSGHGTRLIPDGTLKGVTYVRTPSWVQVSGSGDFSQIGISSDDSGAQFDSSSHNPQGSSLITSQGGDPAKDWVTMISGQTFCVRACFGDPAFCPTQYDSLGCYFLTSNGVGWDDVWQDCEGDEGDPPGVIDGQTYTPGNGPVPTQSIPAVTNCQPGSSIQNGQTAAANSGGSKNASASGTTSGGEGSTSWVPVQTCLPCTATAASGSASASNDEAGSSSEKSDGSSSAGSSSDNPFASEESEASDSAAPSSSASSPASGSGQSESSAAEGGTEQVGVTKLSSSTATSASGSVSGAATITPAPSPAGDLSARELDQWWNLRRGDLEGEGEGEGETIISGDQCCFTTWTPSVVGGAGGAKATGTSSTGSKGTGSNSTGTASGKGASAKNGTAASTGGGAVSSGTGKNGTTGVNGTNGNGTNSSGSFAPSSHLNLGNGGLDKLIGLGMAAGLGLLIGGMALV
ncbi:hypothetical protein L486_00786 [Kwoniella mangroviensis CBS 10435]|uniref:Uncharacterized protein n=1 Tax=Kwoniella mangroviensis CBS 10435 TaxID=1331196 RepID=A0A1B9J058_9TREE|nr:hypothetical protein L486_00786 [Kwoniella mangroviensis CBS 10435]